VPDAKDTPSERSTARENHLTVVLDMRSGSVRTIADDSQAVRRLTEETREAQARGDLKLLAGQAA